VTGEAARACARPPRASCWPHRLALATAGATVVLIVAGGLVTNTGSALAVPDWPTTFGYNMLLFPWSGMVGGVLYEHGHRLLGVLVGVLTLGLAAALWLTDRRGSVRALGLAAVIFVSLQGLLGGLRVILLRDALAILHGCLAQAFFALVTALCVLTAPRPSDGAPPLRDPEAGRLRVVAATAVATVSVQVVLGALTTHAGWIGPHLAGALPAVMAVGVLVLGVLDRHAERRELVGHARALGCLLVAQVALGLGAYLARFTGWALPGGAVSVLVLPVAHRVTAALLLGFAVALALDAWRAGSASVPAGQGLAEAGTVSTGAPA
jgi:heme a synthase